MLGALSPQQALFFLILIVAFGLLITEKLRNDAVAILIIIALTASGLLSSAEALAGFGSEPAIAVAAIFVLSQALHQTGLSQLAGEWIARASGTSYTRIVGVIMLAVAAMSAFTHHVTTTAVMLPVSMTLARDREISPSKLLMPMSFAASLGTTITIIGAPAFLIASTVLQKAGQPGLSVFSIAPVGLAITLVGTLFMLTIGRRLLPDRGQGEQSADRFRLTDYFTELTVLANSPFVDKPISEIEAGEGHRELFVTGWLRHGRQVRAPYGDQVVRSGDVLMVRTSPEQMVAITERAGVELHPITQYGTAADDGAGADDEAGIADKLVQAIVAPASELAGRTLGDVNFHDRYGAIVVGLWRRSGWLNEELSRIRLEAGDVLVLQGDAMEKSGASKLMATWIQGTVGGLNETVVLLVIFGIVAVLTQFMSDAATVALFGPVASALAHGLGRNPEAFVVTVAMAAVVAFLTPIGHHGNLLIYGPGRYQFADFVRVGTPLTILISIVVVLVAQLVWPG